MIIFEHTPSFLILAAGVVAIFGLGLYSAWRFLPRIVANAVFPILFALVLLLLFWCLLQPGRRDVSRHLLKPRFIVALDTSKSMTVTPTGDSISRWQYAQDALGLPWTDAIAAEADIDLLPFASETGRRRPLADYSNLAADGTSTQLREAMREIAARYTGLNVGGVLLLSDGLDTHEAFDQWASEPYPYPVYTVLLEDPVEWQEEPDVRIDTVITPRRVNVGWESEMKVMVSGQGTGGTAQTVQLFRDDRLIDERPTRIPATGGQREVPFQLRHEDIGVFTYRAYVPPLPGETNVEDNEYVLTVSVVDDRDRLLYVEGVPRFEYRFLRRVLLASEQIIPIIFYSGADGSPRFGTPDLGFSPEMSESDLLRLKVIIVGNLSAGELTDERARNLVRFVEEGGSLILLGGSRGWGREGFAHSPLRDVLPVSAYGTRTIEGETPFPVRLEPEALAHPAFAGEVEFWDDAPPVLSVFPGVEPKPGALVLVSAETPRGWQPVVVTQRYGQGRVAAIFTDTLWRWQLTPDTGRRRPYARFWTQLLDWMIPEPEEEDRREMEIFVERDQVHMGEKIEISARFTDPEQPRSDRIEIRVTQPDGRVVPYTATPQQVVTPSGRTYPGFVLPYEPEEPGHYVAVAADGPGPAAGISDPVSFNVRAHSPETTPRPANADLLRVLAASSGGVFYESLEAMNSGLSTLMFSVEEEQRSDFHSLWRTWFILLLLMTLLTLTWIMRKLRHMP